MKNNFRGAGTFVFEYMGLVAVTLLALRAQKLQYELNLLQLPT